MTPVDGVPGADKKSAEDDECESEETDIVAPVAHAESFAEFHDTEISESKSNRDKPSKPKTKGWIGSLYVESVMINGKPKFLCNGQDSITIKDQLEFEDETIRPLDAEECGYYPYSFVGKEDDLVAY